MSIDNDSNNENSDSDSVSAKINAATNFVKAVPIYEDLLQPGAIQVGKAIGTLGETVNAMLMPLRGFVMGMEKIESYLIKELSERLKSVPTECVSTPPISIAGPVIEALKFRSDEEEVMALFADLISSAMDSREQSNVHVSFVEIVKQLSTYDAKFVQALHRQLDSGIEIPIITLRRTSLGTNVGFDIFPNFSTLGDEHGLTDYNSKQVAIDNLIRLGVITIPESYHLSDRKKYENLENHQLVKAIKKNIESANKNTVVVSNKKIIRVTNFGQRFLSVILKR